MKIVVFGASGKVGRIVVQRLLNDGNEVTAFVYGSTQLTARPHLTLITGDVHEPDDVMGAIKGSEVVISTLGSWGTKKKDILSSGITNIISAMRSNGINRVISLTGADALSPMDKPFIISRLFHWLLKISPARKILIDGEQHIKLLAQSGLDWTVLRSPIMNDRGNPKNNQITLSKPRPWETINRHSVANAIADLVLDKNYIKQSPYIVRD